MSTSIHHVDGLSFTAEQLDRRRATLGASEVPAILGLDRYKSPHDIWLQKRGLVPPFQGNDHTEWGLRVEPVIRSKVAEVLGVTIEQPGTLIHPAHTWASATPDGQLVLDGQPAVLEIKNKTDRQSVYWGVPGTDEVPHDIAAQAYWQMLVTGVERAVVAVLFGKSDFRLYYLTRDAEIVAMIFDTCRDFWFRHIEGDTEPAISGSVATRDYLKAKFSAHGDALRDATREEASLIAELRTVKTDIKELESQESRIQNMLLAAIGQDAGLQCSAGRVTWKAPKSGSVTWKDVALVLAKRANVSKEELDALSAEFTSEPSRRFLATFPKES